MDEKLIRLVEAVENEGLDYALTKWADWEELRIDFPELFSHIYMYQYFSEWLDKYIEKLTVELDNEQTS